MEKTQSHKPILIVLEGPAGVGKTTMQKFLHQSFSLKNVIVDSLPEFSSSKIGRLIEEHSYFKHKNPSWLLGINGLMIFLADKVEVLENAQYDKEKLWICDRFITTQYILGLKEIGDKRDNLFAKEIIQRVFDWSLEKISKQSVFIFLDSTIDILQKRLEIRTKRNLTLQELNNLEFEINGYKNLANSIEAKNTFIVEANNSVSEIGNQIMKLIYSTWQQ